MKKKCFRCGEEKPISEFYKHPEMKDGHLNKCIDCTKADATKRRKEHLEEVREYDRQRSATKEYRERQKLYIARQKNENPELFKSRRAQYQRKYRAKHRNKIKAHWTVCDAIIAGKIKAPEVCSKCGSPEKLEAHHEDYSKPLEIVWLCEVCHKRRHREINAERRALNKKIQ
jgi:hypothetical protein